MKKNIAALCLFIIGISSISKAQENISFKEGPELERGIGTGIQYKIGEDDNSFYLLRGNINGRFTRWVEKFDKKYLIPTDIAYIVNDFLEKYFTKMMDYKFTSIVEEDFDKVAEGKEEYSTMLSRFWEGSLSKDLVTADKESEKVIEKTGKACPNCGKDLIIRYSKSGKFTGCSGYPDCKFIEREEWANTALDALKAKYEWKPCPEWIEWTIMVKTGRFGPFLASSKYPEVKWIGKIKSEKDEILEAILTKKWLLIDQETGEELVVKSSRRWPFLAAKRYPEIKISKPIPKDVWEELNAQMWKKEEEERAE